MTDPTQQPPQTPYQQGGPVYPPQQYQPAQQDPSRGYPGQQPPAPPPAGSSRKPLLFAVGAFVAVLALLAGGYAVYDGFIKEDSGVAACKAMRDGKEIDGTAKDSGDDKLTEAEYREAREQFEDSRHDKIREHGTALIDIAWQVSSLPEEQEMGALAFMGPLTTHMSGLQTACADQGVIVNLNSGN
ncbi:hypothetical protein DKT68_06045 [Micromonospora acroterricola]|uniref:Uncharacterized protein n=1 Tax=Micromonospora acroterricola TaxID=2202421 RepID=A0A317DB44_9ACTN|nr:hypothetical protein [Micromonospora acroterricola]PWR11310.1 hypothetical protein DKT68_06045 [Micromonospora acroterricola]